MARITHPQPQVGVIIDRLGGIEFTDGFAEVDLTDKPNLREAYALHGYTVWEGGFTGTMGTTDWAEPQGDVHSDGRGGDIRMPGVDLAKLAAFKVWAGDDTPEIPPLPLPDAVEGETTERVYEEFTIPAPKRTRKAKP